MIVVEQTAPLLTVQDRGRTGLFADGITRSGPLDRLALEVANALVHNDENDAGLEGCLGGASFRFAIDTDVAVTGADAEVSINGATVAAYEGHTLRANDVLTIGRIVRGAVWYLAVRGGIDVPVVLGSRSTLLSAGFGGMDGGPVKRGAALPVGGRGWVMGRPLRVRVPDSLRANLTDGAIPLCPAPRSDALNAADWEAFHAATFTVSRAMSRVGYRLEGPAVTSRLPADIASEPACFGAMQLPPEGQPIVLMADHPTIGGYPIIGVVPAHAVGAFAQRAPGTLVRFERQDAAHATEAWISERKALSEWLSRG